jgi:hypothetical protein
MHFRLRVRILLEVVHSALSCGHSMGTSKIRERAREGCGKLEAYSELHEGAILDLFKNHLDCEVKNMTALVARYKHLVCARFCLSQILNPSPILTTRMGRD